MARLEGSYWNRVDTRPYMRAQMGLAQTPAALGRDEAAIAGYRGLLGLNPGDNQGARYVLLEELVRLGRLEEAFALVGQSPEDASASWTFTWALLELRAGRKSEADARLATALKFNELVPRALSVPVEALPPGDGTVTLGGMDEAVEYARDFGEFWCGTAGALEWIVRAAQERASQRSGRHRSVAQRRGGEAADPKAGAGASDPAAPLAPAALPGLLGLVRLLYVRVGDGDVDRLEVWRGANLVRLVLGAHRLGGHRAPSSPAAAVASMDAVVREVLAEPLPERARAGAMDARRSAFRAVEHKTFPTMVNQRAGPDGRRREGKE
jgi:hypothetical protein